MAYREFCAAFRACDKNLSCSLSGKTKATAAALKIRRKTLLFAFARSIIK